MKEKTKSYMAGIVDSEGCIRLAKHNDRGTIRYSPRVYVSNQSWVLMKWIVKHFGGKFVRNVNNREGGVDWYIWYLQSIPSISAFLVEILPYLRCKKDQATCLLEYLQSYTSLSEATKDGVFHNLKSLKRGSVTTETHSDYIKSTPAYLAGFFDGEGCIRVGKTPVKNTQSYHLTVSVTNKDTSVLKACSELYGGHIGNLIKGRCPHWVLSDKPSIERFLLYTLPYLVAKKDEAEVGLEYIRLGHKTPCPREREALRVKLVDLKQSKIQPDLTGDRERVPAEMLAA